MLINILFLAGAIGNKAKLLYYSTMAHDVAILVDHLNGLSHGTLENGLFGTPSIHQ